LLEAISPENLRCLALQFPVPSGAILAIDGHPHFDFIEESALGVASPPPGKAGSIL